MLPPGIDDKLRAGCVIPAHPLALTDDCRLDEQRQRVLTRYYLAAGAGGLAVGVHTTQFAIHDPTVGWYRPVLQLAAETADTFCAAATREAPILIAGIVGDTKQAVEEAITARELGYHIGLLSLTALRGRSTNELIDHARNVGRVIPLMGFYLQETISGMVLPRDFWQRLVEIEEIVAIKIAPFNRYQTLEVLEAVAASGRGGEIALYTGNDDNILIDLLTSWEFATGGRVVELAIVGGLLGQWACWTKRAVEHLDRVKEIRAVKHSIPQDMLTLAAQMTLANRAVFDAENGFAGCIPGISYALKKQGLMANTKTLAANERLSPDQATQIDQIVRNYPHLTDDEFVKQNIASWM